MKFQRLFTVSDVDPFANFEWEARVSRLVNRDGSEASTEIPVTVPKTWSTEASDILAQKYFRRAGVPSNLTPVAEQSVPKWLWRSVAEPGCTFGSETDARQVFRRMAGAWTYHGWKEGYFDTEDHARIFYDELCHMLAAQLAAPNSPQFFNQLWWAYGITGTNYGNWRFTTKSGVVQTEPCDGYYKNPPLTACYLQSVQDDLVNPGGIMDLWINEAKVFKGGSGSGVNFSSLRGAGEPLSGGGKSSGLMSFLKVGDSSSGAIKSGGTTRRAARLLALDDDHPDIESFVTWKVDEENKVAMLVTGYTVMRRSLEKIYQAAQSVDLARKSPSAPLPAVVQQAVQQAAQAGVPAQMLRRVVDAARNGLTIDLPEMTAEWNGAAYQTVSGQNANNSVRLSDAFMRAVEADEDWRLYGRVEKRQAQADGRAPVPCKTIKARELFRKIASSAWQCADPGVHFSDTINEWNTCANDGAINTSNPCCLVGETLVDTAEGRIRIEELHRRFTAGEPLPKARCYDIKTGAHLERQILRSWDRGVTSEVAVVTTSRGITICCTPDHRFLCLDGQYRHASCLKTDMILRDTFSAPEATEFDHDSVASIEVIQIPEGVRVYDIEVDGVHNFAITDKLESWTGSHSLIVHNSEYLFLDETACNLAALNLVGFLDPDVMDGPFDSTAFQHACELWTTVLDISVGMAGFPTEQIARGSGNYRTIGLGFCNAGGLLMRLGLPYDSVEGRGWIASITAMMHFSVALQSTRLAEYLGAFPRCNANREHVLRVMHNHRAATMADINFVGLTHEPIRLTQYPGPQYLLNEVQDLAKLAYDRVVLHGLRNAQLTLVQPTGTCGMLLDADTLGIEPDFALVKFKQLAGGGYFKLINQSIPHALKRLGYKKNEIRAIVDHAVGVPDLERAPHDFKQRLVKLGWDEERMQELEVRLPTLVHLGYALDLAALGRVEPALSREDLAEINDFLCGAMTVEGAPYLHENDLEVFDCANRAGRGERFIAVEGHLLMLAAVQPFLSGSASKTINLPRQATEQQFADIYWRSWQLGLKCNAAYRDGSKLSQVLDSVDQLDHLDAPAIAEKIVYRYLAKRRPLPDRREGGYTQKFKLGNQSIFLRTGEYDDGALGEIFIDLAKTGSGLRSMTNAFAIAVSLGLQHGVPLDEYVEAMVGIRFEPFGLVFGHPSIKTATSLVDMIFQDLALTYLDRANLPEAVTAPVVEDDQVVGAVKATEVTAVKLARLKGFQGDACAHCGQFSLVRDGSCLRCTSCGASSGGCG